MNKKFLSAILFGALMVTSTGTFVSCKDYDDDIDAINKELTDIKSQIASLQSKVDAGNYVTNITKAENGINVAFSNGTTTFVETGVKVEVEKAETATIVGGEWVITKTDGTTVETGIPASGVLAVENNKGGYTLTVVDAEGNTTEIELPATKVITDLKATTITGGVMGDAVVTLYYGAKVDTDDDKGLTFNGKTYAEGTYLTSQNATLSAIVNPKDADAAKYTFKLVDTKGNAPIAVSDIKQNMSEEALSRADKTANQGVWDMTLTFADASNVDVDGTYALTTETSNGIVASPYDVKVTAEAAPTSISLSWNSVEGDYNTDIDLTKAFSEEDWAKYIVDYKFEITDETAANAAGVTLNGDYIKSTLNKDQFFGKVKASWFLVNGQKVTETIGVYFKYVAPTTQLGNVEWTITNETDKNVVYLSLKTIQSQLTGSTDTQLPTYAATGTYTWADGTELDEGSVVVNGVNYGKDDENDDTTEGGVIQSSWITTVGTGLYVKNDDGDMVAATSGTTKIQDELYAKFTFDAATAFPGEYIVEVGFKKGNNTSANNDLVVPVKLKINEPVVNPFTRLSAYFNGNEATAYGKVEGGVVKYNLFDLFKEIDAATKANVTFTETKHSVDGHTCAAWLSGTSGDIVVAPYSNAENADNSDAVYSTRAIKAVYTVFGNAHITKVADEFNLTVKSAIKEGEFTTTASQTIETSSAVKFFVTDFNGVDVFGDKFIIGETYEYDKNGNLSKVNRRDARIAAVTIEAADDNAEDYLTISAAFGNAAGEKPAAEYFTVARKSGLTQLVADTECKIKVTITDVWGVSSEAVVTVLLKKF